MNFRERIMAENGVESYVGHTDNFRCAEDLVLCLGSEHIGT